MSEEEKVEYEIQMVDSRDKKDSFSRYTSDPNKDTMIEVAKGIVANYPHIRAKVMEVTKVKKEIWKSDN